METTERAELIGTTLVGSYRVGRRLGVGGTGVVLEAVRLCDGHPMVVKTMRPIYSENADLCRRLRREGEVANMVPHPGLVSVHDEGVLPDGSPFLVMKRIEGESLAELLQRVGSLPPEEVVALSMRVASILHSVHAFGYVHRDVKPEHLILRRNAHNSLDVTLLDFGVCAAHSAPAAEKDSEKGRVFGTPAYVSPEQAAGQPNVCPRADVFGLGVVMFESLVGRVPFRAPNVAALLRRILREDAPRIRDYRTDVPAQLESLVARMLARDPMVRFPSMRALSRALAPLAADRIQAEATLGTRVGSGGEAAPHEATVKHAIVAA